jgi:hypothetical protein
MGVYLLVYAFLVAHIGFLWELTRLVFAGGAHKPTLSLYTDYLWRQQHLLFGFFLIAPAFIWDMIKFSHRVAGPAYRCRNIMNEMANGKTVPEFQPREHDLMPELFDAFNAMIKEWNKRINAEASGQAEPANAADKKPQVITPSAAIQEAAEAKS